MAPLSLNLSKRSTANLLLACMLGRLWGSLQLAIHAGVDVPVVWHGLYREINQTSFKVAQPDVRMRWVMGELSHLLDTFTFQWVRQRACGMEKVIGKHFEVFKSGRITDLRHRRFTDG